MMTCHKHDGLQEYANGSELPVHPLMHAPYCECTLNVSVIEPSPLNFRKFHTKMLLG